VSAPTVSPPIGSPPPAEAELRRLLKRSRVFDEVLKRSWLNALPLMTDEHRRELATILQMETEAECSPTR
jgi:hypothetical protein